jgi:hypothetical protein
VRGLCNSLLHNCLGSGPAAASNFVVRAFLWTFPFTSHSLPLSCRLTIGEWHSSQAVSLYIASPNIDWSYRHRAGKRVVRFAVFVT